MREYAKQIEGELEGVENASIQDYIKESQNIASLHNQITACDAILEVSEVQVLWRLCLNVLNMDVLVPKQNL